MAGMQPMSRRPWRAASRTVSKARDLSSASAAELTLTVNH
jgi:hypothetical protein